MSSLLSILSKFDHWLFSVINAGYHNKFLDFTMLALSSNTFWAIVILLISFYLIIKRKVKWSFLLKMALLISLTDLFCYRLLKPFFERNRPCHQMEDVRLVQDGCGSLEGFPSNHAANGSALATFAYISSKSPVLAFLYVLVFLVSYSRIYLGVHFPFDVMGGALIGMIIAIVFSRGDQFLRKYFLKFPS